MQPLWNKIILTSKSPRWLCWQSWYLVPMDQTSSNLKGAGERQAWWSHGRFPPQWWGKRLKSRTSSNKQPRLLKKWQTNSEDGWHACYQRYIEHSSCKSKSFKLQESLPCVPPSPVPIALVRTGIQTSHRDRTIFSLFFWISCPQIHLISCVCAVSTREWYPGTRRMRLGSQGTEGRKIPESVTHDLFFFMGFFLSQFSVGVLHFDSVTVWLESDVSDRIASHHSFLMNTYLWDNK